ncbi:tetratricopeptide repeat protein [Aquitalea aquatica]|uniref:Tetratricopeptide repeat protein n=1 Tax=Aquitalea aquatica TaxID=3044273 RepID=A0A838Y1G7_9NEIS|nr:tetratricopeptide repeat protein [Aquitalea magnusonii]MBA4707112.1 tetratricopeptide repeat protein [Aquitalea magnusonii]
MTELTQRLRQLHAYLEADPANIHLLFELADLYLQFGQAQACEEVLSRLLAEDPGHFGGRSLAGICLMRQNHLDDAIAAFDDLRREGWEEPALFYNLAYALLLQGRYAEAEIYAAKAASQRDILPQAGPLFARALHFQGKVNEAVAACEQALSEHPEWLPMYGLLATLYLDQENFAAAEIVARQVLDVVPKDPDAATVMGMLSISKQDLDVAIPMLDQACTSRPNSSRALMGQGLVSMLQGDLKKAELRVSEALQYMPGHVGSWHVLAWCRILQQQPSAAKEALLEALRLDRNFADTHGGLAIVAIMEGKMGEAQKSVKRALGLNPSSFPGLYAESLIFQAGGHPIQAQAIYGKLMESSVLPDGTSLQQAVARTVALSPFGKDTPAG